MQKITDSVLIANLRLNDNTSYKLLYNYYFPSVLKMVRQNSGRTEDAEDIFQESIIVLSNNIKQPDFELTSSLKTYLYSISRNLWLKKQRNNRRLLIDENAGTPFIAEPQYLETEIEHSNEEKVRTWLSRITMHCQQLLKAIFFYQEPMENLIDKMGWKNKHSASNQKYKCIEQVKKASKMDKGT